MIVPLIIAMCYLPADISIKFGTIDLQAIRILALVGFLRIYVLEEPERIHFNTIDKLFFAYNLLGAVIYILASESQFGAFVYKCGTIIDSIFLYIVLRQIVRTKEEINLILKTFSICIIALLPFAIIEFYTANNLFSILGRSAISIRDGEIRTACTFSHAILFGSFAAALVPIFWADFKSQKSYVKLFAILCCFFFIYSCSSSGPLVAVAASLFFILFFNFKQYSARLYWFVLATATFIHLARETPIWHFLYVRISIKGSSTGYHRYLLMEAAVKEFWNWWLFGYGDVGPQWHVIYWPWTWASFTDMTNHYLLVGVRGGFFTMLLFIILCYKSVKVLGLYSIAQKNVKDQWLWWGFTVMMLTHCISFLSVAYFGQITMLLYLTIAIAAYAMDMSQKEAS